MHKKLEKFEKLTDGLHSFAPGILCPHVNLSHDNCTRLACLYEESLSSHTAARRDAEAHLLQIYQDAQKQMAAYLDWQSPAGFGVVFQSHLNQRLAALRQALSLCRTERSAPVTAQIQELLVSDSVFQELSEVYPALVRKYELPPLAHYSTLVTYSKHDPSESETGFSRFIAKAFSRYGYDLLPAILIMEEDAAAQLNGFRAALQAQTALLIDRHILTPVQKKLPLLRVLLDARTGAQTP